MIAVIAGTNRPGSRARQVAEAYCSGLAERGLANHLIDLRDLPEAFLLSDLYGARSKDFRPLERSMVEAKGFVFIVPEYNGSFPGVLKAYIDAFEPSEVFHGKKAALVGISSGRFGNLRGLDHLTGVLNYLQVTVLPFKAHLMGISSELDASGELTGEKAHVELDAQLAQLPHFFAEPEYELHG